MKCQKCGANLEDGVLFCRECGGKVEKQVCFCRECGSKVEGGSKFCSNCGAKIELQAIPVEPVQTNPDVEDIPAAEPIVEGQAEQPKKRTVRRKKKGDDDNKELFPFYEQSLF